MNRKFNDIEQAARQLARKHAERESNQIIEIWLFPDQDNKEVRLIELDNTAMPHKDRISAYGFPPYSGSRIPFRVAIAVIRPDEKDRLEPPVGWGNWNQAKRIWPHPQTIRRINE